MNATLTLPITLADLSSRTRDWLLSKSARLGVSPMVALNAVLEHVAAAELEVLPLDAETEGSR